MEKSKENAASSGSRSSGVAPWQEKMKEKRLMEVVCSK